LSVQRRLLAPSFRAVRAPAAYGAALADFERPSADATLLERLLYADMKGYLVELLMRQDQMSMAASVESRVPFLDHHLVEYAVGLPDRWKRSGLTTKRVLRQAMNGLLPDSILTRRKMGFPVPFGTWAARRWSALVRDVLLDGRSRDRGIVNPTELARMLRAHETGEAPCGDEIWSLLNLELWYRTFVDGLGVQVLPDYSQPHAHPLAEVRSAAAAG